MYGSFAEVAVVTVWGRRLGWFLVLLINLFFVYFSVLKTSQRSKNWQNQYVVACVAQFITEVFLFESVTVLWVHWVIPRLISKDVRVVINSLRALLNTSMTSPVDWKHPLDTTNHFFVSKAIAMKHPHLLESTIVLSFHSYLPPGRMSTQWARKAVFQRKRTKGLNWFFRVASVSLFVIGLLHTIGTLGMNYQTFIMSLVLPIALVAVYVVVNMIIGNVIILVVVLAVLVCLVVRHFLVNAKHRNTVEDQDNAIIIIPSAVHDPIDAGMVHRALIDSHEADNNKRAVHKRSRGDVQEDEGGSEGLSGRQWGSVDMQLEEIDNSSLCGVCDSGSDSDVEVRVRVVSTNSLGNGGDEVSSDGEGGKRLPAVSRAASPGGGGGVRIRADRNLDTYATQESCSLIESSDESTTVNALSCGEQVLSENDSSSIDATDSFAEDDSGSDSDIDVKAGVLPFFDVNHRNVSEVRPGIGLLDDGGDDAMSESDWVESAPRVGRETSEDEGGSEGVSGRQWGSVDMQLEEIDNSSLCGVCDSGSDSDVEVRVRVVSTNSLGNGGDEVSSDGEGGKRLPAVSRAASPGGGGGVRIRADRNLDTYATQESCSLIESSDESTTVNALSCGEQVLSENDSSSIDATDSFAEDDSGSDSDIDVKHF